MSKSYSVRRSSKKNNKNSRRDKYLILFYSQNTQEIPQAPPLFSKTLQENSSPQTRSSISRFQQQFQLQQ